MVNFTKDIFIQSLESKAFTKDIEHSSIEDTLNKYPAFNSAYLIQAYLLKNKNEELFERKLPFIAINVNDRSVLHDFIYAQETEIKVVEESDTEIIVEEAIEDEITATQETDLKAEEKEVSEKIEEKAEASSSPIENESISSDIDSKEDKRVQAMQTLQDELFGNKISSEENIDPKEQKRLDAMKKLQDELFHTNTSEENKVLPEKKVEIELPKEPVQAKVDEEVKIKNKLAASSIIQDLIKRQEEKVKDIIEEENTFEEKDNSLDFIDWLKLKSVATQKSTKTHTPTKSDSTTKKEEKEDLVPFDRVSAVEAEMHQEVKASSDPLENFISSQIIRKKKKKSKAKHVIVSETLAEILTLQQKYSEALEVYELLSLKYPQKSIYFAHQIEKIKTYL